MGLGKSIRLRTPINRTCAGKYERLDAMADCGIDQYLRFGRVVVQVTLRKTYGLSDFYISRQVDHRPGTILFKSLPDSIFVPYVSLNQWPPSNGPLMTILESVKANWDRAKLRQCLADMASYVSCTTGYQHSAVHYCGSRRLGYLLR